MRVLEGNVACPVGSNEKLLVAPKKLNNIYQFLIFYQYIAECNYVVIYFTVESV